MVKATLLVKTGVGDAHAQSTDGKIAQARHGYLLRNLLVLLVLALACMPSVQAAENTWYMVTAETASGYGALWTPGKWNSSSDGKGTAATTFDATDTYVSMNTIVAAGKNKTFAGGLLISKKAFWTVSSGSFTFPNGLELAAGQWRNRYGTFDIYGPVAITYTDYPYPFYCDGDYVTTFHGKLSGASNIRIVCGENNAAGQGSTFVFAGDNSEYLGTATIKPTGKGQYTKAGFASFPGTLSVQSNAVLLVGVAGTDTVSTYDKLTLANGCTLELKAQKDGETLKYPALAATTALSVGASVTIVIPQAAMPSDGLPHGFDVLTGPEGTVLDTTNFILKTDAGTELPRDYLAVEENGRTLRLVFPAVIESGVTLLTGATPESGVMKLNNLTLKAGAILKLNGAWSGVGENMVYSSASVAVDSELAVNAPVKVSATRYAVPADGRAHTIDILTAPAGVTLDLSDFAFERTEDGVQIATLGVRQAQGRDILTVSFEPVVEMVESDKASGAKATDAISDTAWFTASSWSDNLTPHAGAHYLVRQQTESSTPWFLRTPSEKGGRTFPGASLTLGKNVWLMILEWGGFTFAVADLRVRDGSSVLYGQSCYGTLAGRITMEGGSVNFGAYGNGITVKSDIFGSGSFLVSGPKDYGSYAHGGITLTGDNLGFTGTFDVEYCRSNPDTTERYQALTVSASDQLGGPLAVFDAAAIRLAKYGHLVVKGNVSVSAESNRGLTVDGLGGFVNVVDGKTFSLGTRLTLTGPLTKMGAGTLVLGGAAEANGTAFSLTGGALVVAAADALNGTVLTVESGTSLALAVDLANTDLCRYGIRNVKTDTPFVLSSGDRLPLSLRVSDTVRQELKKGARTIGLVTVKATAAATVRAMLAGAVYRIRGFKTEPVEWTDAETNDVTFGLSIAPSGLAVIVR